ncbi:DNA repair helicase [Martensiomyces pterosporus]|nr:DNA repair helicase [Martensiomyces pterosporus]
MEDLSDQHTAKPEPPLPVPQDASDYSFPMKPYAIQLDFMRQLFETIENGRFGIFESPTGTGKSLSIICGALTWLKHNDERSQRTQSSTSKAVLDDRPEWVVEYEKKRLAETSVSEEDLKMEKYQRWVAKTRRREAAERRSSRYAAPRSSSSAGTATSSQLPKRKVLAEDDEGGSDEEMIVKDDESDNSDSNPEDSDAGAPEEPSVTKIFYASRTHSQLQQFIGEVKRTDFARRDNVKCISLGSRWQLCINARAREGCHSVHPINERCVEMQQNSKRKRCTYLPPQHTPMLDFKDAVGQKIMDIEELAKEGQRLSTCPYYGSRAAVNAAQVVTLPYNMLLSKSARESMGISLKNHVVIVDEAHNLVDTILAIHSVTIDLKTVKSLLEMMQMYFTKYWRRLKGSNAVYIRQTQALLKALSKFMQATLADAKGAESTAVLSVNDFLQKAHADHINVYKIDKYLKESKLGRKLNMFSDRQRAKDQANANANTDTGSTLAAALSSPAAAVAAFESFMECIGRPDRTGARLVVRTLAAGGKEGGAEPAAELKYLLLDPSEAFGELCKEARAVILAGGTMKPANDVVEQLLPETKHADTRGCDENGLAKLDPLNAKLFSWNHVVPSSHICAQVISSGPTGQPLRFTFQDQSNTMRLREAGQALASLCSVVPGGVVAFFPSYSLLGKMYAEWSSAGIVQRIAKRKPVFCESSGGGGSQDMLAEYMAQVRRPNSLGAVLLSVVGGRLSEGINFSDELGRAVVMVGVPYPNLASPELAERLAYYESMGKAADGPANKSSQPATSAGAPKMGPRGRELYESLCMRAVNQSIGRAIRHRNDYAAIVFLDSRYGDARIAEKLPTWMSPQPGALARHAFGPALAQVASFFKRDFT